jgi:uncharacterized membrane protein
MSQELVLDNQLSIGQKHRVVAVPDPRVSFIFSLGAFSILPLIFNYLQRPSTEGTFVHSHHTVDDPLLLVVHRAGVSWRGVLRHFIGIPIAWLIWIGAWLWKAYRLIVGVTRINRNEPAPV